MRGMLLTLTSLVATIAAPATALTFTAESQPKLERTPGVNVASGKAGKLSWSAASTIIGGLPTSDVLSPGNRIGGGNAIYKPSANKSGVVALIMTYANGSRFICSGSVLSDGMSIATAGHCVSSGAGTANPIKTTAYFFDGNADARTPFATGGTSIDVSAYFVNPLYTGEVIDQNDIAILRLQSAAPKSAARYDLYTSDIKGKQFNVAGYGLRSTVGGAAGNTAPAGAQTGYLREGDNIYDYAWGDAAFGGFFTDVVGGSNFFGTADVTFSYISDFDNGLAAQNQAGRIAAAVGSTEVFGNLGLGAREVGIAGGDSGGPGFVDGKLSSINSYGLTFGTGFGDFGGGLNSGWGEFSGYVPVFIHTDFIAGAMAVPEPDSWMMLIAGFGLTGAVMRRRRTATMAVSA